jgi:hypothetical protein
VLTLLQEFRIVGTNKIGMLAWHMTMKTPEYPDGREIVLIANDVTFQSGSFGVSVDLPHLQLYNVRYCYVWYHTALIAHDACRNTEPLRTLSVDMRVCTHPCTPMTHH